MKTVIGVKFLHQCRVYYFDPGDLPVKRGDGVIVETAQGIDFGVVSLAPTEIEDEKIKGELKKIVRIATDDDYNQIKLNRKNEKDALRICRSRVNVHELNMKLLMAEYAFDRTKLTFYFTSENYVDFRNLVKDLASIFRTRIELRQVGVRDETRLLGGLGVCGRELCCASWMTEFAPVAIKEAKEQNLSLNSVKISGCCGRLMCCIKNEADTYAYLNSKLPSINAEVRTPDGHVGTVKAVNVLLQKVTVLINADGDDREEREYKAEELQFRQKKREKKESEGEEKPAN
ncbi:MAG: stage 0 sporulation family protein [Lachnospiraceae bacterium]|nr:stage 0 sporulation family protein [Lachnospiraceae bacterium]